MCPGNGFWVWLGILGAHLFLLKPGSRVRRPYVIWTVVNRGILEMSQASLLTLEIRTPSPTCPPCGYQGLGWSVLPWELGGEGQRLQGPLVWGVGSSLGQRAVLGWGREGEVVMGVWAGEGLCGPFLRGMRNCSPFLPLSLYSVPSACLC